MRKNEKKKEILKKFGYFAAGIATTVGVGYAVKKIYEGKIIDCNIEIFNDSDNVVISNKIQSVPLFLKAFLLNNTTYLTSEEAKAMANGLISYSDRLIKKE